ncbi:hypothetical protein A2W14_06520 [Candidatus Gottesmanbacteria bacterium RBG_16_37_8]|uniref:PIN domain-containing protein n=1 Tax=Candidatus Gottesmanbacteria bacterium RBG_16_37_8 TaxID=1798371 RepID=A0A1F5YPV2_9BACT|nr:MAG: hypothetical protein A2W14_06520 [Candidatus Gottesmanbacteria bacterium RBG_16_37_8]
MNKYFLDTSIIIPYIRGKKEVIEFIDNLKGELISSYVCLAEIYEGIFSYKNQNKESAEKNLMIFFRGLDDVIGLNEDIAKTFGLIRTELRKKGLLIEDMDIFIASSCLVYQAILVTENVKHFDRIRNLQILPL